MIPFTLDKVKAQQVKQQVNRKDRVVSRYTEVMESYMELAVDWVLTEYQANGRYKDPELQDMGKIMEDFYRSVIESAFHSCDEEMRIERRGRKRLAKLPMGLPKDLRSLEQVFRDKRYWPRIMKRSEVLTDRMRRQYKQKLRRKFGELMPLIRDGEVTMKEAKDMMMSSWQASKSRVETVFRTETTNYFGRTQTAYYEDNPEIIGFLFDSVRDSSRTPICRSRHGLVYRPGTRLLAENTPACHWNCRSHLIPLVNIPRNIKMLEDPQRDPSKRKVVSLPKGWKK